MFNDFMSIVNAINFENDFNRFMEESQRVHRQMCKSSNNTSVEEVEREAAYPDNWDETVEWIERIRKEMK